MTMSMYFPMTFDTRKIVMRIILVAFLTVGSLQVTQCGNTRDSYDDHGSTAGQVEDAFR